VTAKLPNGDLMALEVPVDDDIGDRIAVTSHPYEAVELSIVDAFLSPNPAIIDVGANVGNHAIYWALTYHAEVSAFEPYHPARRLLDANVTRNGVGTLVDVHEQALGEGPGRATPGASHTIAEHRPTVWVEVLNSADRATVRAVMADHDYPAMLMLSPTNALFLPRRSIVLRLAWHPRSMYHYVRRSLGPRVRQLRVRLSSGSVSTAKLRLAR